MVKVVLNVEKKYFFGMLLIGLIIVGVVGVFAYGTSSPSSFGHSVGEIDWSQTIPGLKTDQLCLTDGCIGALADIVGNGSGSGGTTIISSSSGVSKIVAGSGISISPLNGTGAVTINNIAPSQWAVSEGNNLYYNTGNIGIGVTNPTNKLDVAGNVDLGKFTFGEIKINDSEVALLGHIRLSGGMLYSVTNAWCKDSIGTLSVSSTCETKPYYIVTTSGGFSLTTTVTTRYYYCDGSTGCAGGFCYNQPPILTSPQNCANTLV